MDHAALVAALSGVTDLSVGSLYTGAAPARTFNPTGPNPNMTGAIADSEARTLYLWGYGGHGNLGQGDRNGLGKRPWYGLTICVSVEIPRVSPAASHGWAPGGPVGG